MLKGWFGGSAAGERPACIRRIKDWAAAGLGREAGLSVSEIACLDPACPGTETVILVMEDGRRTQAAKIAKALADVTESDVLAALVEMDETT